MKVLVCAAGRHSSTAEIAARIAAAVRAGLPPDTVVDVLAASEVIDTASYDALVLGSAVYMSRWLADARAVAQRIATEPQRPVWLFSSGPVGDPPQPVQEPAEVADLVERTHAREHRIFAGRLDRDRLGFAEKAVVSVLRVQDGDDRDWDQIDTWGAQIATDMGRVADGAARTR
jgi:menaquinone-dependent protoporphyrinogen oxidase